jgi:cysteinyl-tRNA synthetase
VSLHLYDTATLAVRPFEPIVAGQVSIYHCGLTVQSAPHVGHIRKEVVFDILRRWLTRNGLDVTVIANITDIDDKTLAKAAEAGVPWWAHAYDNELALHDAYALLGCLPPTYEPRATGHIPEMLELIAELIERGHAYPALDGNGDVYFDVHSWPGYGELSRQRLVDMEPAADAGNAGKKDPRDFALWKGHKQFEPISASWPSPWGRGRPGWHIECSAMAGKYLGDEFDIHGGGIDLRFPHHENELAQSRAAGRGFARFWMHNLWVTASGEKMSKSLGNGMQVSEVVKRVPPIAVRYYLAQPHYRSHVEFSFESLDEAAAAFSRIQSFLTRAVERVGAVEPAPDLPPEFSTAMDDDLATPAAIAIVHAGVRAGNAALDAGDDARVTAAAASVRAMLGVLGLDPLAEPWVSAASSDAALNGVVDGLVRAMLDQREAARARRDYPAADAVRAQLSALGVNVEDTPTGPRWELGFNDLGTNDLGTTKEQADGR